MESPRLEKVKTSLAYKKIHFFEAPISTDNFCNDVSQDIDDVELKIPGYRERLIGYAFMYEGENSITLRCGNFSSAKVNHKHVADIVFDCCRNHGLQPRLSVSNDGSTESIIVIDKQFLNEMVNCTWCGTSRPDTPGICPKCARFPKLSN